MKKFDFQVKDFYPEIDGIGFVQAYVHEPNAELPRTGYPSVVVIPGGSYWCTSERESEPVAMHFYAEGYNVFVLRYTTTFTSGNEHKPTGITPYPICYKEAGAVIDLIRNKGEEWYSDGRVAVVGFSAGGHLTATVSTRYNDDVVSDGVRNCKPDATILVYPVISAGECAHRPSFELLTGDTSLERHEIESAENYVHEGMSPVYICHTVSDELVSVQNTLIFASRLAKCGVDFECHVFPYGSHGFSTAHSLVNTPFEGLHDWVAEALHFLKVRKLSIETEKK